MLIRSFIRPVAVAIALTIGAAPLTAFAQDKADTAKDAGEHHKKHEQHFPMKAEHFEKMVERRIEKSRAHLDKMIVDNRVPEALAKEMRKDFEDGAVAVRTLAKRAEDDGTVTKEEAKEVHELAKTLRKNAAAKYGLGRHAKR